MGDLPNVPPGPEATGGMKEEHDEGIRGAAARALYAVIYEGRDPVTGKERRAGTPPAPTGPRPSASPPQLAAPRPAGRRPVADLRRLPDQPVAAGQEAAPRHQHLPGLRAQRHDTSCPPSARIASDGCATSRSKRSTTRCSTRAGRGLAPKTVYSIHLIIRGALADALRRGLVTRNVAVVARAPKQRSLQRTEGHSLTDDELRQLLRTAAGHRFFPILWLTAMTGMRRNEVLGLKWPDIDFNKRRLHLNRGLVAVGYEVHQTRGKTRTRAATSTSTNHPRRPRGLAGLPGRRVRRRRHRQRGALGVHRRRRRPSIPTPSTRPSAGSSTTPAYRRSASTICATPTGACSSRKASRSRSSASGSVTPTSRTPCRPTSTSCPACRPTPPAPPNASPTRSHRRHDTGGTPEEHPEEDRLTRRNAPPTTKAQVADLGLHYSWWRG